MTIVLRKLSERVEYVEGPRTRERSVGKHDTFPSTAPSTVDILKEVMIRRQL
jgi:hypothetical protein